MTRYSDIQPDRDIFADFYGLDNVVSGHTVSPMTGGTNNAEFELLTRYFYMEDNGLMTGNAFIPEMISVPTT